MNEKILTNSIYVEPCKRQNTCIKKIHRGHRGGSVARVVSTPWYEFREDSYDWFNDIQMIKNVSKEKISSFTNQIPIKLLERILLMTTSQGDTILDPFFGSGSLAFLSLMVTCFVLALLVFFRSFSMCGD